MECDAQKVRKKCLQKLFCKPLGKHRLNSFALSPSCDLRAGLSKDIPRKYKGFDGSTLLTISPNGFK